MKSIITFPALVAASTLIQSAMGVTWYYLDFVTPNNEGFVEFSMDMSIPKLPSTYATGTYYLWPGLQPSDNSGVYQNVLDGRSGTWWIGTGWCCSNPSLPWGGGFNVYEGDTVTISNVQSGGDWTSSLTRNGDSSTTVTNSFAGIGGKILNQAIFAIELYDENFDFGSLVFSNIVMKANTPSTSWCNTSPRNYNGATNFRVTDLVATANSDGSSSCTIGQVNMIGPN